MELLELARGVLVADALDARSSDLTRLREQAPDLAAEFEALRARFDDIERASAATLPEQPPAGLHTDTTATLRQQLQAAWTRLIERIRSINSFAGFLATPNIHDLALLADKGPIVLVYSSPLRCDALVLRNEPLRQVEVVPLTGMSDRPTV